MPRTKERLTPYQKELARGERFLKEYLIPGYECHGDELPYYLDELMQLFKGKQGKLDLFRVCDHLCALLPSEDQQRTIERTYGNAYYNRRAWASDKFLDVTNLNPADIDYLNEVLLEHMRKSKMNQELIRGKKQEWEKCAVGREFLEMCAQEGKNPRSYEELLSDIARYKCRGEEQIDITLKHVTKAYIAWYVDSRIFREEYELPEIVENIWMLIVNRPRGETDAA